MKPLVGDVVRRPRDSPLNAFSIAHRFLVSEKTLIARRIRSPQGCPTYAYRDSPEVEAAARHHASPL